MILRNKILIIGGVVCGILAAIDTLQENPFNRSEVIFITIWSLGPIAVTFLVSSLLKLWYSDLMLEKWLFASTILATAMSILLYGTGVIRGAPDPDTAGHIAKYLYPIIIYLLLLPLLLTTFIMATVRRKRKLVKE